MWGLGVGNSLARKVSEVWKDISVSVPGCVDLETTEAVDGLSQMCTSNSSPFFPCLIAGAMAFWHTGLMCFQCDIGVTLFQLCNMFSHRVHT